MKRRNMSKKSLHGRQKKKGAYNRLTRRMQISARRPVTLGPSPRTRAGPPLGSYELHPPSPSLLFSPEADTHFTIPQRVEGWVIYPDGLHAREQSPIQVVTGRCSVD